MTRLNTFVLLTRQLLVARHATTETRLAARNRPPLLVIAITKLRRLDHTRRTNASSVAIVEHGVTTRMTPDARLVTRRLLRPARHWRVNHLRSALALELIERGTLTGQTMSRVTRSLALVFATTQRRRTWQWTNVINVYATLQVAFVLAATPLLRTLFLATRIVRTGRKLFTLYHLVHLATATLYRRGFLTRRTCTQVTLGDATVRTRRDAATEDFITNRLAKGNFIETRGTFSAQNRFLSTGTGFHSVRSQVAVTTRVPVARALALVVRAVQVLLAETLTRELHLLEISRRARNFLCFPATVTLVLEGLIAVGTVAHVTLLLALVQATVAHLLAEPIAGEFLLLRANHRLCCGSAATVSHHGRLAGGTSAGVAQERARMGTARLATTNFTATVRHVVAIVLRVLLFPAEAVVVVGHAEGQVLAGGTSPAVLLFGADRPFDGAGEVKDVVTVLAVPRSLRRLDRLAADEALEGASVDLHDLLLALGNVRGKVQVAIRAH